MSNGRNYRRALAGQAGMAAAQVLGATRGLPPTRPVAVLPPAPPLSVPQPTPAPAIAPPGMEPAHGLRLDDGRGWVLLRWKEQRSEGIENVYWPSDMDPHMAMSGLVDALVKMRITEVGIISAVYTTANELAAKLEDTEGRRDA